MPRMAQTRWLLVCFSACVLLGSSTNILAQSATVQGSFQGPKNAGIEVTADPSYRLLLDNSSVRAFLVEIAPGKSTQLHWHDYDYMVVTLADSTVGELVMKPKNEGDAKKHRPTSGSMATYKLDKKFGDEWRTKGGILQILTNAMDVPYRNVTLEFRGSEKKVPETTAIVLKTGESATRDWQSANHLLVFLTDTKLTDAVPGQPETLLEHKAGEVAWLPAGKSHTFTNAKTGPALVTTVEFR
jgi:quercetin dioxygenase-like cupin family protein